MLLYPVIQRKNSDQSYGYRLHVRPEKVKGHESKVFNNRCTLSTPGHWAWEAGERKGEGPGPLISLSAPRQKYITK